MTAVQRLAAFTTDPAGGNPAGVQVCDVLPDAARMQVVAAEVGYSETAFLAPDDRAGAGGYRAWQVRYFSPVAEVDFCGHATIAAGVVLAGRDGPGRHVLHTNVGPVPVDTAVDADGAVATLTSVPPQVEDLDAPLLVELLALFGWRRADLDPRFPPAVGFAGVRHPIVVLRDRAALAAMDYPFDALRALMTAHGWTTVQLACATGDGFACRNPFPVGGVVEDPATGAAAAALGGYLRARGLVDPPAEVRLVQGEDMGRRSVLHVTIPPGSGGIAVSGRAVAIPRG